MNTDLETRRHVLVVMYQRYLEADRSWNLALNDMRTWFPKESQANSLKMGDPGSPIRRLYERRKRALFQLEVARIKLDVARQRLAKRRPRPNIVPLLRLTYTRAIGHGQIV